MDAIICSRNSKRKYNTFLTINRWTGVRRYIIAFGILMTVYEIISGSTYTDTMLFFRIFKPVLMALFFSGFILLRNYTLKTEDIDLTLKKKLALIIANDAYYLIGICTIIVIDGVETFKDGDSVETFFHMTKFLLLILFSLNSFFFLSSKISFYSLILCYQAGELIAYNHTTKEWRICVQTFVGLAALILIVFVLDKDRNGLTSSYQDAKNQEKAWRHVIEFLKEGVIIIDKSGEYVYGNRCVNKILGFEPRLSELNYNVDLSKIKNMKFHTDFRMPSSKSKNNTSAHLVNDGHLYEDRLLNINLERTSNLKEILDFLRSKWINTVDLLRKLSNENGGYLHLEGEVDELGIKASIEARITILSYEDKNNLLVALESVSSKAVSATAVAVTTRESDRLRDKTIASVFHHLLHPLHGGMNYLKGAIENALTPPSVRDVFLSPALNSMNCLSNIIYDLVDLFNLNSSGIRMKFSGQSLLDTIKESLALIAAQAEKKGLAIVKTFRISPKLVCYTDHRRLQQILQNILSTSIKFTFKGSVSLSIVKVSYKDFMIKIEDTGIGLKDEDKKKLLDDNGKIKISPLGPSDIFGENEVGLMIANELTKKLGPIAVPGSCGIFFESEEGKGSSFQFLIEDKSYSQKSESGDHYKINIIEDSQLRSHDFESEDSMEALPSRDYHIAPKFLPDDNFLRPRPLKAAKGGSSRKSVSVSGRKTNSGKRLGQCNCPEVLIVDDDMFCVSSLEQIMVVCRFSTFSCFNGLEGIREIMRRKEKKCGKKCSFFKLIFVEMSMPVMGGEEFISTIKDLMDKNEIPFVPIIACTNTQEEGELKRARGAGAVDCIIKPIFKEKVLEIFQKIDIR